MYEGQGRTVCLDGRTIDDVVGLWNGLEALLCEQENSRY
jgi:hypothetical protein